MTQADGTSAERAAGDAGSEDRLTEADLGKKLCAAREQRSMSLEQAAEALHLDEETIVAIEQGHFEKLGAAVYVRGHLKAYAQLIGLSPDRIVAEYRGGDSTPVAEPPLPRPGIVSVTVNPVLWAGGALVLLLGVLLGIYVWLGADDLGDSGATARSHEAPVADAPVQTTPDATGTRSEAPGVDMPRVVAVPQSIPPDVPAPTVEAGAQAGSAPSAEPLPSRPAATMRLGLQFNQESWVEISDANRRLLFGLQHKGNRREVTGEPPFNLLIGNARGVDLTVNDEPFDVPAAHVRGKVARFEITGAEFE